jgi:ketosteroid isomerase-like protein
MGFTTAEAAEEAFYAAFSRSDHQKLMAVWANSTDIVCIHPLGPRHVGVESVAQSWAQILTTDEPRDFKCRVLSRWSDDNTVVHVVDEIISVPGSDARFAPVLATNVYRRIADNWYLVAHHASIDARQNISTTEAQTRH